MNIAKEELRKFLKRWLKKHTLCGIQYDSFPCATCFYDLANKMKMPKTISEKMWQLTLWARGDYNSWDFDGAETHAKTKLEKKR